MLYYLLVCKEAAGLLFAFLALCLTALFFPKCPLKGIVLRFAPYVKCTVIELFSRIKWDKILSVSLAQKPGGGGNSLSELLCFDYLLTVICNAR